MKNVLISSSSSYHQHFFFLINFDETKKNFYFKSSKNCFCNKKINQSMNIKKIATLSTSIGVNYKTL